MTGTTTPSSSRSSGSSSPSPLDRHRRRDNPTFVALTGFFSGVVLVIVVPTIFAAVLHVVVSQDTAESLYPFVLLTLAVPLILIAVPRTRLFGAYLLIGVVSTAIVVVGVAGAVLFVLYRTQAKGT